MMALEGEHDANKNAALGLCWTMLAGWNIDSPTIFYLFNNVDNPNKFSLFTLSDKSVLLCLH